MGRLERSIVSGCALLLGVLGVLGVPACSTSDVPRPPTPAVPAQAKVDAPPFVLDVAWSPCALESDTGDHRTAAECALVDVPLVWGSDREHVRVFVKHAPPSGAGGAPLRAPARARAALWLLGRHPGSSGADMETLARELTLRDGSLDVYLPDVRGSGRSTRLACPPQEAAASPAGFSITSSEWAACVEHISTEWGGRLAAFDVTSAAKDIAALASHVAHGRDTFLYGLGFGSYVAARVLTVSEMRFAGVVYDSPCLPGSCQGSREDERYIVAGKRLMRACAKNPTCRGRLGDDPWSRAAEALAVVDAKTCTAFAEQGVDGTMIRDLYASWLVDPRRVALIPALTYRILRCGEGDTRTLTKLANDLTGPVRVSPGERWASRVLAAHLTLSELWESPAPSPDALFDSAQSSYFSRGGAPELAKLYDVWPRYSDPRASTWPTHDVPTLVLSGLLDPDNALDQPAKDELARRSASLIEVETVTGGLVLGARRSDGSACGVELLASFLENGSAPDDACTRALAPLAFEGSEALARATFGSASAWEPDPDPGR